MEEKGQGRAKQTECIVKKFKKRRDAATGTPSGSIREELDPLRRICPLSLPLQLPTVVSQNASWVAPPV